MTSSLFAVILEISVFGFIVNHRVNIEMLIYVSYISCKLLQEIIILPKPEYTQIKESSMYIPKLKDYTK